MSKTYIVVILIILGCDHPNTDMLKTIREVTEKVQPIVDESQKICDTAIRHYIESGKDSSEIDKYCDRLIEMFREFQLIEMAAIIAAGGEPCLDGCE